jgi:hypothetical protein
MRSLVTALAATLLLAGCSEEAPSSQPTAPASSASPSPSAATLTRAQLDATLLAAADMGAGWTGSAPEDSTNEDPTPGASPSQCDLDAMETRLPDPLYGREVTLTNVGTGVFLAHEVDVLEPGTAAEGFAEVNRTFAGCSTLTTVDEDSGRPLTLAKSPLAVGPFGEEIVAVALKETAPAAGEQPFAIGFAFVRRGDIVVTLAGFSAQNVPEDSIRIALTKAMEKLEAVLGGAATPAATASY